MKWLWVLACLLLFAAHPAFAETRSVGYVIWNVIDGNVYTRYMLPEDGAKYLTVPGTPILSTEKVADYVLAHLSVSQRGEACPALDQGEDVGRINTLAFTPGLLRFEIIFHCRDSKNLSLSDTAFSDRIENHTDFGRVQVDNGGFVQHVFTAGAPRFDLPSAGANLRGDSLTRYAALGLSHVFHSVDIVCFMLALLLVARLQRDYWLALCALTVGYGVAITLSALNLATLRFGSAEAFNGLLLFLTAAVGVTLGLSDPRRGAWAVAASALVLTWMALILHSAVAAFAVLGVGLLAVSALLVSERDARVIYLAIVPFLFAFLDGFVLPRDLAVLSLSTGQVTPMLLGFDTGSLIVETAVPLCLVAVWFLVPFLRRMTTAGGLVSDLAASAFIGCGIFWFVIRLHG